MKTAKIKVVKLAPGKMLLHVDNNSLTFTVLDSDGIVMEYSSDEFETQYGDPEVAIAMLYPYTVKVDGIVAGRYKSRKMLHRDLANMKVDIVEEYDIAVFTIGGRTFSVYGYTRNEIEKGNASLVTILDHKAFEQHDYTLNAIKIEFA